MAKPDGFTALQAARIQDTGGNLLTGTILITTTDANDLPLDAVAGGVGGPVVDDCEFPFTNGVLDPAVCWIPTSPATTNPNTSYRFTFLDATGKPTKVWTGVQVTGDTFNLDTYQPILGAAQAVIQPGPQGNPGTIGLLTAPASTDAVGYPNTNPSALASTTALNPGLSVFSDSLNSYGLDLGAAPFNISQGNPYYTRAYQPETQAFGTAFYSAGTVPSGQSSFSIFGFLSRSDRFDFFPSSVGIPAASVFPNGSGAFYGITSNATNAASTVALNPPLDVYSFSNNSFGFDLGATQFNLPGGNQYYTRAYAPTGNGFGVSFYPAGSAPTKQSDYDVHALLAKATSVDLYADPVTGIPAVSITPDGNVTVTAAQQDSNFRFTRRRGLTSANKVILYGDSRSSTDYSFNATAMAALTGCEVYNGGFSGFTAAQNAQQAQMQRIISYNADVIFALIGGNDDGAAGTVGTLAGGVAGEPVVAEQDLSTDYSGTYFVQAMSYFVRWVTTSYYGIRTRANLTGSETEDEKNAKIAAVKKPVLFVATDLPQQRLGPTDSFSLPANWQRKNAAIVEVCAKYHVQCIDLFNLLPFVPFMPYEPYWPGPAATNGTDKTNNQGIYYMDGLHPNQFGWELIAQAYCNAAGL